MTRLFTGDFSTGDFSQWSRVINEYVPNGSLIGFYHPNVTDRIQLVTDEPDSGYAARFEIQPGDGSAAPEFGGARAEVMGDDLVYAADGTTRWYAWSMKFDETFPNNRKDYLWESLCNWKAASLSPYTEYGPAVISFSWPDVPTADYEDGYVYLYWAPQSEPYVGIPGGGPILAIPLQRGNWIDFKMRAYWKKDNTGTLQFWVNNVRQTFNARGGGGTTFTGQTVCGGTGPAGVTFHSGPYRNKDSTCTDIVYFRGFRIADTEDSL